MHQLLNLIIKSSIDRCYWRCKGQFPLALLFDEDFLPVEGKPFIKTDIIKLMNLITTKEISFQDLKTLRIKLQNSAPNNHF